MERTDRWHLCECGLPFPRGLPIVARLLVCPRESHPHTNWGHTTKWSPTPLPCLKELHCALFEKILEALNVGLVEWK